MVNDKNAMMQQYQAYAAAAMTVNKVRQVVMLYDGAIRFVQQAIEAIEKEDYETRFNQLIKASDVVVGMQSALDFEQGGEISKLLYDYYASIDARLFAVHRSNDAAMCEAVIKELRMMRDAWDQIDKDEAQTAAKSGKETRDTSPTPVQNGGTELGSIAGVSA